jgi:iron-sulfur cluster repair protein YtfE (RIC family)
MHGTPAGVIGSKGTVASPLRRPWFKERNEDGIERGCMRVTEALRAEHLALHADIEELRATADAVGYAPPAELRRRLEATHRFLTDRLLPHAHAEEVALYPAVGRALGAARATATMSRDHIEVLRLTERLGAMLAGPLNLHDPAVHELRALLYGLYGIVRLHFLKEEEVLFPLLDDHLSDLDVAGLVREMARAAGAEHQRH